MGFQLQTITNQFEESFWASVKDEGNIVQGHLLRSFVTKKKGRGDQTNFVIRTNAPCTITVEGEKEKGKRPKLTTVECEAGKLVCIKGGDLTKKLGKLLAQSSLGADDKDDAYAMVSVKVGGTTVVNGGPNAGKEMRLFEVQGVIGSRDDYEEFMGEFAQDADKVYESARSHVASDEPAA